MFEAYKVAVKLSLVNEVSAGLVALAGQFQTLNKHVGATTAGITELERRLGNLKRLGLVGGALLGVGSLGLAALKGPLDEARKFQSEMAKFASLGFGDKINADAEKFAMGMKTVGTSARENLQLLSDSMAVFKNLEHAQFAAPLMARMKFANEAVFGADKGGANERKFMDMLKVIEFRGGLSSEKEFGTQADYVQKVISGSRNRVDAGQLLAALKTGGVALSQRSNEHFYLGSEPLIQEFGGQRYGTGAMSIYQNLVQSRGTITAQQELYRLGLLDPSKVSFNKLGQLKKALPGSFKGSGILEKEGELALLEKVLLPAFASKGITGDEGIIRELGMILGNRTGSSLMSRIYQQRSTIHMQSEANRNAMGIEALGRKAEGTLDGQMINLHAKWADLMKELGTIILPAAIRGVQGLISVVTTFRDMAREFPVITKAVVGVGAALSALAVAGGALMLMKAGVGALALAFGSAGAAGAGAGLIGTLTAASIAVGTLGVGLAAIVGLLTGTAIKNWLDRVASKSAGHETSFGGDLYDRLHGDATISGKSAAAKRDFVQPGYKRPYEEKNGNIYIDGRKVGEIVSKHQAKAMSSPATGTRVFDGTMTPQTVGAAGSW
jgi:hypothetical protein